MAAKDTFRCRPIGAFVEYYLKQSSVSADPFARNYCAATHNNDLNPKTNAEHHSKAEDFLKQLEEKQIYPDLVIFDPPYSMEQCKRSYESCGYKYTYRDTLSQSWTTEKNILSKIMPIGGVFLHFGWHTNGMGVNRGFTLEEILIVHHGGARYDTLCMAERRTNKQELLF